eukprot:scaffold15511_cov135-Isochrysis_galbana.AAC.5
MLHWSAVRQRDGRSPTITATSYARVGAGTAGVALVRLADTHCSASGSLSGGADSQEAGTARSCLGAFPLPDRAKAEVDDGSSSALSSPSQSFGLAVMLTARRT